MIKAPLFPMKALVLISASLLAFSGCGNGKSLALDNAEASRDGVTVTLETATAQRMSGPDRYEYAFSGTIENNSEEGVMKVVYTFSLRDENGEEFRSFAEVYDGVDTALAPHTAVEFSFDGVKWGAQSVPASVSVGISSVQTETQLPPVRLPQPGEFLYQALNDEKLADIRDNPPVELSFHIDRGGFGQTAVFSQGAALDKAVELLCGITIGAETGEWVTDNYNWIRLQWEDGTQTFISLNLRSLEYSAHSTPHVYSLEHLEEFWSYAAAYLKED